MTIDELNEAFASKDKLINSVNDKLDSSVSKSQSALLKILSEGILDKLELDSSKRVLNNQKNRNLLLSADALS